ncbi:hypothetical protein MAP00_008850 [Monascus purpureus]|nr:hypothetical protein MAP00_008850 [Monascus purpureus]
MDKKTKAEININHKISPRATVRSEQQPQPARDTRTRTRTPLPSRQQDIRQTREYKVASRRWTSTIVALPILLYTSYVLYERAYGNQSPKHLGNVDSAKSDQSQVPK